MNITTLKILLLKSKKQKSLNKNSFGSTAEILQVDILNKLNYPTTYIYLTLLLNSLGLFQQFPYSSLQQKIEKNL